MKNPVVILIEIHPPLGMNDTISYKDSYRRLSEFAIEKKIDLRFVLGIENYENGIFTSYWKFQNKKFIHVTESFQPGIVYVRSRIKEVDFKKRVNHPYLDEICRDKLKAAQLFPSLFKKTIIIPPNNEPPALKNLATDLIVLKPRYGSNGDSVQVIHKDTFNSKEFADQNYIAQELIDSSGGITGIVSQKHELRLFIFNGDVKAAYVRLPAKNSYLANISRGGTEKLIEQSEVPESATQLAKEVDSKFLDIKPRLYTIDIMYEKEKPWIVELNDNPGMPDIAVQPFTDDYLYTLLDFLEDAVD